MEAASSLDPLRRLRATALAAALLTVSLLGACSDGDDRPDDVSALAYEGGEITEAAYLALVSAVRQCMADKGYEVGPIEKREDRVTYGFAITGGQVGDTSSSQDFAACELPLNFADAEIAYQEQNVLAGAERERLQGEFLACLEAAGVGGVTADVPLEEITQRILRLEESGENPDEAFACVSQYASRLFGAGR